MTRYQAQAEVKAWVGILISAGHRHIEIDDLTLEQIYVISYALGTKEFPYD